MYCMQYTAYFENEIRDFLIKLSESKGVSCEFVSIIDATLLEVERRGYRSLRIFGSKVTTNYNYEALDSFDGVVSPYSRLHGIIKLVALNTKEKENMQKIISLIKHHGPHGVVLQNSLKELIDASPVPCILACTEFDLLMNNVRTNSMVELVDSRKVLFPTLPLRNYLSKRALHLIDALNALTQQCQVHLVECIVVVVVAISDYFYNI